MLRRVKKIEEEFRFGLTAQDMMDSGLMEKPKDMEDLSMQKAMCTRENGLRIKLMVTEFILITMVPNSQEIGYLISNKASEKSNGQMVLSTKENTKKE